MEIYLENHQEFVNRTSCSRPVRSGGFGRVLVKTKVEALRLQWITRYTDDSPAKWKLFATYWLDKIGRPFTDRWGIIEGNLTPIPACISAFYTELILQEVPGSGRGAIIPHRRIETIFLAIPVFETQVAGHSIPDLWPDLELS